MGAVTKQQKDNGTPTIRDRLKNPKMIEEIGLALPRHCDPKRMARVALTALTRTPKLAECDQHSFFKCLLDLSSWGLEPDGRHAHLIPFRNNKRNVTECQLIIDYKGYVQLAYRSGHVRSIHADVVRQGDLFVYDLGLVAHHTPWFLRTDAQKPPEQGEVIAAYCHVELKDGVKKSEVMSLTEIDAIRKRSKAAQSGPWVTDWNEMAKKTACRRIMKWIPISAEIMDAMVREDELEDAHRSSVDTTPAAGLDALRERLQSPQASGQDEQDGQEDDSDESPPTDADAEKLYQGYRESLQHAKTEGAVREVIAEAEADDRLDEGPKQLLHAHGEDLIGAM